MSSRRVGLWLVGAFGSIGSTLALGLASLQRGLIAPIGMVGELPDFAPLELMPFDHIELGGHDLRPDDYSEILRKTHTLAGLYSLDHISQCEAELKRWSDNVRAGVLQASEERIRKIAEVCTGFLYCVSLVGITGERAELPDSVKAYLTKLRKLTTLPLCVGFGVSKPSHVKMLRDHCDGIIVGSALVRKMETIDPAHPEMGLDDMMGLVKLLREALNPTSQ